MCGVSMPERKIPSSPKSFHIRAHLPEWSFRGAYAFGSVLKRSWTLSESIWFSAGQRASSYIC